MKKGYVYILSNIKRTVFYVGLTNDITRRVYEHKNHLVKGFTDKYNVTELVYVEETALIKDAIAREKQIKRWSRNKKIDLIKSINPNMIDLSQYDMP